MRRDLELSDVHRWHLFDETSCKISSTAKEKRHALRTLGFRAIKEEKWAMQNFSRVKKEERRITIDSSSTGTKGVSE